LARVVEIINGYTITFENTAYAVNIVGGNSNISDVVNLNLVSVRSANSAGYIEVVTGDGGFTSAYQNILTNLSKTLLNRSRINTATNTLEVYDDDNTTIAFTFDLKDASGTASSTTVYERVPQ